MIAAVTFVAFVMLAAVLISAIGPIPGVVVWVFVLAVFQFVMRRVRKHVWG